MAVTVNDILSMTPDQIRKALSNMDQGEKIKILKQLNDVYSNLTSKQNSLMNELGDLQKRLAKLQSKLGGGGGGSTGGGSTSPTGGGSTSHGVGTSHGGGAGETPKGNSGGSRKVVKAGMFGAGGYGLIAIALLAMLALGGKK